MHVRSVMQFKSICEGITADSRVDCSTRCENGEKDATIPVTKKSPTAIRFLSTPAPGQRLPLPAVMQPRCSFVPKEASTAISG